MDPTIVVAFDGSEESCDGLALARELAALERASVVAVDVLQDLPALVVADRGEQREVRARIADIEARIAQLPPADVPLEVMPVRGASLAHAVHQVAESTEADAIVVGPTHLGPLGRALLGPSSDAALAGAPCAVASPPRGYGARERRPVHEVGVALDGSPESRVALDAARALADLAGARLTAIHVEPTWSSRRLRVPGSQRFGRPDVEAALAELGDTAPELRTPSGDPARNLAAATADGLDVLVMGSRGHGPMGRALLGSVSSAVMRSASCPVVVVPRGASRFPRTHAAD